MASGLPDWHRSVRLTGKYGTDYIPIVTDENGNLFAVFKGSDGVELRTVKVDADGSLLAKLVGGSVDVGTVSEVTDKDRNILGSDGVDYRPVAVDSDGIMLSRLKGYDGSQLKDVLVDADGQIITVLRGQSGNYVAVDSSGYLTSVLKGTDADGTLRSLLTDDEGRIVGVFKGRYTNPFDLVLDLPFDEGSGSTVYDQSLYGNNGTIHGATWTKGRYGYALSFDGTDDYVEVPHSDVFNVNQFTITLWLKANEGYGSENNPGIIAKRNSTSSSWGLWIRASDGKIWGRVWQSDGTQVDLPATFTIQTDTWYFVAFVADGSEVKILVDGEQVTSLSYDGTIQASTFPIRIGYQNIDYFNGIIDDVRIYSRALTDEEIRELYEGKPTLRVDRNGNLSALLYGKVGSTFKPVELDSLSNLRINIEAQTLSELSTGVRTYQAESAEWISADQTASLASNANETVNVRAPSGYIYELVGLYLAVLPPDGATSGTHEFYVYTEAAGVTLLLGESNYNSMLSYDYNHWRNADVTALPPSDISQLMIIRGVRLDNSTGVGVRYRNLTDVSQNKERLIRMHVRKIKVS